MTKHTYHWKGLQRTGLIAQGSMDAQNIDEVKEILHTQGILPQKITRKFHYFTLRPQTIKPKDITLFSRQLSSLLNAGIPLTRAFDIICKGQANRAMRILVETIQYHVESGFTFAESLQKHPVFFNALYCHLIDIGERSGTMCTMLNNIAHYKEKMESIKQKIKKIATYPLFILLMTFLVTNVFLVYVIPQFESLFAQFGAKLPPYTQLLVSLSKLIQHHWIVLLGVSVGIVFGFIQSIRRSAFLTAWIDTQLLRIPLLGVLFKKAAISRFTRTLYITLAAGVPLVSALSSVAGATGNRVYSDATYNIKTSVSNGDSLHTAMKNTSLFPHLVLQFIAIGEESSTLEPMLQKIADYYDDDVTHRIETLNGLLEPLIMALLGLLVGSFVIAIYLPIINLGSVV